MTHQEYWHIVTSHAWTEYLKARKAYEREHQMFLAKHVEPWRRQRDERARPPE